MNALQIPLLLVTVYHGSEGVDPASDFALVEFLSRHGVQYTDIAHARPKIEHEPVVDNGLEFKEILYVDDYLNTTYMVALNSDEFDKNKEFIDRLYKDNRVDKLVYVDKDRFAWEFIGGNPVQFLGKLTMVTKEVAKTKGTWYLDKEKRYWITEASE